MDRDRSSFFHPLDQATLYQADRWQQPPEPNTDLALRGTQYLGVLRDLAVQPSWISLAHIADPPGETVAWIGQHIHRVNQRLQAILTDGLDCFEAAERPRVQILAAPIAPQAGVDGFCNDGFWFGPDLCTAPTTLMVDPGRIVPADWPGVVAHELAHGVARSTGHGVEFGRAIAHLCLAQDLPLPPPHLDAESLSYWPPCRHNPQPEAFWLGQLPPLTWS